MPQLSYWFLLVYFSYCVVHHWFFVVVDVDKQSNSSSRSLLNISCISLIFISILFLGFWFIFTVITLNSFSGSLPISPSFICLLGFYLVPSSKTYFSVISFLLMGRAVFLSCWLFSLRHLALVSAGSWAELGLNAEMRTSGGTHTD